VGLREQQTWPKLHKDNLADKEQLFVLSLTDGPGSLCLSVLDDEPMAMNFMDILRLNFATFTSFLPPLSLRVRVFIGKYFC